MLPNVISKIENFAYSFFCYSLFWKHLLLLLYENPINSEFYIQAPSSIGLVWGIINSNQVFLFPCEAGSGSGVERK